MLQKQWLAPYYITSQVPNGIDDSPTKTRETGIQGSWTLAKRKDVATLVHENIMLPEFFWFGLTRFGTCLLFKDMIWYWKCWWLLSWTHACLVLVGLSRLGLDILQVMQIITYDSRPFGTRPGCRHLWSMANGVYYNGECHRLWFCVVFVLYLVLLLYLN